MEQIKIDELYAVARVTASLLTGKAKKTEFTHYVWFYENVTDILARNIQPVIPASLYKGGSNVDPEKRIMEAQP